MYSSKKTHVKPKTHSAAVKELQSGSPRRSGSIDRRKPSTSRNIAASIERSSSVESVRSNLHNTTKSHKRSSVIPDSIAASPEYSNNSYKIIKKVEKPAIILKSENSNLNRTRAGIHDNSINEASTLDRDEASVTHYKKDRHRTPQKSKQNVTKSYRTDHIPEKNKTKDLIMAKSTLQQHQEEQVPKFFKSSENSRPRTSTIRKSQGPTPTKLNKNKKDKADIVPKKTSSSSTQKKSEGLCSSTDSSNEVIEQQLDISPPRRPRTRNIAKSENEEYEEDFEEYESDFEDVSSSSSVETDTDSGDHSPVECNKESSGLILHPSIVRRQPTIVSNNVESKNTLQKTTTKLRSSLLKMSTRSSTFLVNSLSGVSPGAVLEDQLPHTFINFASALERSKTKNSHSSKAWKRGKELLELITLDEISYDICEIPPMKYDTFISSFGKSDRKQASIQTGNVDEDEVQTDETDFKDKWTQHPPYDYIGVGGSGTEYEIGENWQLHFRDHAIKLNKFLQNVSPVIISLLNEDYGNSSAKLFTCAPNDITFSKGYLSLKPIKLCQDSPVIFLIFSSGQNPYILSVHGNFSNLPFSSPIAKEKGIMCLWNLHDNRKPECILTSNSQPTAACFAPNGHEIVIAGMVDGSIMLWDINEPSSMHHFCVFGTDHISVRHPTYSTAVVVTGEGHHSCVVSIQSVQHTKSILDRRRSYKSSKKAMDDTFHVLSLEDMGVLNVWVVVRILKPDNENFDMDLGLTPGGRMKLVWSSTVDLCTVDILSQNIREGLRTFDFRTFPSDPSHILVTTDIETIFHVTGHAQVPTPKYYSGMKGCPIEIRCICFSPHVDNNFLVGCNDGSVIMFSTDRSAPLKCFGNTTITEAIICIHWSPSQPTVFFTLDSTSTIYVWNFSISFSDPIYSHCFLKSQKVLWFTLYGCKKKYQSALNTVSSQMALAKENGEIEVHVLHPNCDIISEVEYKRQLLYIQNI